jgi:hypothetical protein
MIRQAAADGRSPRPVGIRLNRELRDSVLDCGCPLPLCTATMQPARHSTL